MARYPIYAVNFNISESTIHTIADLYKFISWTNKRIFYEIKNDGSHPIKCFQGLKIDDLAECESVYCATPCYPEQSASRVLECYSQCVEDCKSGDILITNPWLDPHIYWGTSHLIHSNLSPSDEEYILETSDAYRYTRYNKSKGEVMHIIRILELGG